MHVTEFLLKWISKIIHYNFIFFDNRYNQPVNVIR
jgi:hypothetical protein